MKTSIFTAITVFCFLSCTEGKFVNSKELVLGYYFESYCEECGLVITNHVYPMYQKLKDYVDIDFVPYGNANTSMSKTGVITIECQHGEKECLGMKVQICAQKYLSYDSAIEFIACTEKLGQADKCGPKCAKKLGFDFGPIRKCSLGDEGAKLLYLNGVKTVNLKPRPYEVPWVTYNGVHRGDTFHLFDIVCSYLKHPKPPACNEIFL